MIPRWRYGAVLDRVARVLIAVGLLGAYAYYVWGHLRRKEEIEDGEELSALYFQPRCELQPRLRFITSQLFVALMAIFLGAHIFVENLKHVADVVSIAPIVLSIIATPIATELPEKFNSVLWVRQGKDTLAIGNMTGAMVFQSCIPVAIGVLMTEWALDTTAIASAVAALASGIIVYAYMKRLGRLDAKALLIGLPLYVVWLVVAF